MSELSESALLVTVAPMPGQLSDGGPAPEHQEGDAADAIRHAEVALAHQNSTTAQVDLQVVAAVLNAHQKAADGKEALAALQRDIEGAVATRSDLDTPAGARDFQRYLIGKLRDIQAVVAGASLDDTSNSALMAAWTSLYNSSKSEPEGAEDPRRAETPAAGSTGVGQTAPAADDFEPDPYFDAPPDDDPGLPSRDMAAPTAPPPAAVPGIPSMGGGGGLPGGGGLGTPAGFTLPFTGRDELSPPERPDARRESDDPDEQPASDEEHDDRARPDHEPTEGTAGPTTVTLPNGDTLTAATPQLAAVIEAAASGTPIADAFRQQGMTIPPPGTAVPDPVDPSQLAPGDIGMFTDRHALALGESRALVNGQIQHITTVSGPDFLGWEHPPAPVGAPAPDAADPPAPTRPAIADRIETA